MSYSPNLSSPFIGGKNRSKATCSTSGMCSMRWKSTFATLGRLRHRWPTMSQGSAKGTSGAIPRANNSCDWITNV